MAFWAFPPLGLPAWYDDVEQKLVQLHEDYDRANKLMPVPDPQVGVPFTLRPSPSLFQLPPSISSRSSSSQSSQSSGSSESSGSSDSSSSSSSYSSSSSSSSSGSSSSSSSSSGSGSSSSSSSATCDSYCCYYWSGSQWLGICGNRCGGCECAMILFNQPSGSFVGEMKICNCGCSNDTGCTCP